MTQETELPALPKPRVLCRFMPEDYRYGDVYGFTADQMRAYAAAAVLAERERWRVALGNALAQLAERKMAPVQGYAAGIPWSLHLEAYDAYVKRHGRQQALIEGGCRGGFGTRELDDFIPGWRERVSEIVKLRAQLAERDRDAERYRWLRDVGDNTWTPLMKRGPAFAVNMDAAIDAAMRDRNA